MQNRFALGLVAVLAAAGCSKSNPKPEPTPTTGSATAPIVTASASAPSAVASEAPAASVPVGPPPICNVQSKKVWSTGANKLAGLTEDELGDGRVLIGLAIGNQPHVLIMSPGGKGTLVKVPVKAGSVLATPLKPGEGTRSILRVTPVHLEGDTAHAFVDFRDEFKDKRRRVACGPADSEEWWVAFDEIPYLSRKDKDTPEGKAAAFKKDASGTAEYHEIRDCRTFADVDRNETYILGSELQGVLQADDKITWKSIMFIDLGAKSHEKHIYSTELKGDPPKMSDYEVPVSRRLDDGSFLLATRNGARLMVGLLNPDKTLRGDFTSYPGFPTLPDLASDGEDVILSTSLAKGKGEYGLRALRIHQRSPTLPRGYSTIVTDATETDSETDPDFTRDSKGRRWIAHIEGERGKGRLSLAPIDASFHLLGRPYQVSSEDEKIASARLVAMGDGGIMIIYIRDNGELVSTEVHCSIAS
ncbi:MAG: hypothetical protein HY898_29580 [Deltaproteobacteria bacterium]|nr:hypothetical protein [Deltaproteobacteria bacterium]